MSKYTKKTISWLLTLAMMFTMVMPAGAVEIVPQDGATVAEAAEPLADGETEEGNTEEGAAQPIAAPVWPEDMNLKTTYYSISFNQPAACPDTNYELVYRIATSAEALESETEWSTYGQTGFGDTFADYKERASMDLLAAGTTYYVQAAYRTGDWGEYVYSAYSDVKEMATASAPESVTVDFSIVAATKPSATPEISADSADYKGAQYFTWYGNSNMALVTGTSVQGAAQAGFDTLGVSVTVPNSKLSVTMPDYLGGHELARKSYGNDSNWYVTVMRDGVVIKETDIFGIIEPHDGEKVILHYVFNYKVELISCNNEGISGKFVDAPAINTENYKAADAVKKLIEKIDPLGDITVASKPAIDAADAAYNELADEAKAYVSNYSDLTAAKERLAKIESGEIVTLAAPQVTVKAEAATADSVTVNIPAAEADAAAVIKTRCSLDGVTWTEWADAAAGDITISNLQSEKSYRVQAYYKTSDSTKYANSAVAEVTAATIAYEVSTVNVGTLSELVNAIKGADTSVQTLIKLTADIELPSEGAPYNAAISPAGANIILDGDGHKVGLYSGNQYSAVVHIGANSTVTLRNIKMALLRTNDEWTLPNNSWSNLVRFVGDNGVLNVEKDAVLYSNGNGRGIIYNGALSWRPAALANATVNIYGGVIHSTGDNAYSRIINLNGKGTVNIIPNGDVMLEGLIENTEGINVKPGTAIKSGAALSSDFATYTPFTTEELANYNAGAALTYGAGVRFLVGDTQLGDLTAPVVLPAADENAANADVTYVISDDKVVFTVINRDALGVLMFRQDNNIWRHSADADYRQFVDGNTFTFSGLNKDTDYTFYVQTASLTPAYKDAITTLNLHTTYTVNQLDKVSAITLEDKTATSIKHSVAACTQDNTAITQFRMSADGQTWGDWQDSPEFTGLQPYTDYHFQARYHAVSKYWSDSEPSETVVVRTKAAGLTAPVLAEAASARANTVTLTAPAASAEDTTAVVWYRMSADNQTWGDWQQSAVFSGLKPNTRYYFQAKYAAGAAAWVDSAESNTVMATTVIDENAPMFTVGQVSGRTGEEVKVNIEIKNNPGIASVAMDVGYDADKLELVGALDTKLLPNGTLNNDVSSNPYTLYWEDTTAAENMTANGVLATLTFKVKADCAVGDEAVITVSYDPENVFDLNLNNIEFDTVNGAILVVDHKWNAPTYKWSSDYTTCTATRTCGDVGCEALSETETVEATVERTEATETENGSAVYTAAFTNPAFTTQTYTETLYAIKAEFAVEKAEVCPGTTVDIDININENPGITTAELYVDYNGDKLELINVKDAGLLNGAVFSDSYAKKPYYLSWNDALAKENNTANGTVATLTFKVKEACVIGESAQVSVTFGNVYDWQMQDVIFRAVNGGVTVTDHKWGDAAYVWSADHTVCTAQSVCACGEKLTEKATAEMTATASTCSVAGNKTYTAKFNNSTFAEQTYVEELPLAAHNYVVGGSADGAALIYTCSECGNVVSKNATENTAILAVSDAAGSVDEELQVVISAKNNPGIIAATLQLGYDEEVLQLVKAENLSSLKSLRVDGHTLYLGGTNETADAIADGAIIKLTFKALAACDGGTAVSLSYKPADIYNYDMEAVEFAVDNGVVVASIYLLGDVNDDGSVDIKDVTVLRRYLAEWENYADIVKLAADVDVNGEINIKDATILRRYLAGWDGVELGKAS